MGFFWQGGKKIPRDFSKGPPPPLQKPKNTKNQKPKVEDSGTHGNSGFQETLLATYKRAQIKNIGFEKER